MTRGAPIRSADAVAVRCGPWAGLRRREFDASAVAQAIAGHERGGTVALKDDERSRVTVTVAGDATVVVKEVRKGGLRRRLADAFRGAPARRAFAAGWALRAAGVGVASPLAYVARTRGGVPLRSLLVSTDLRSFPTATDHAARDPATAVDRLCDLVVRLHAARAVHGDLRAQHVHLCGPDLAPSLVDLEAVTFARTLSDEQRIDALAQLNASLPDALVPAALRDEALARYAEVMPFARGLADARARIVERSRAREHLWRGGDCR